MSAITLCVLALAVFSFFKNAQQTGIKRIGNNLYQITSTGALKSTDEDKFKSLIIKRYGIKSFAQPVTVHFSPEAGLKMKGMAMAEQKISSAAFTQNIIEDGLEADAPVAFKSDPSLGQISQILSAYNIN